MHLLFAYLIGIPLSLFLIGMVLAEPDHDDVKLVLGVGVLWPVTVPLAIGFAYLNREHLSFDGTVISRTGQPLLTRIVMFAPDLGAHTRYLLTRLMTKKPNA